MTSRCARTMLTAMSVLLTCTLGCSREQVPPASEPAESAPDPSTPEGAGDAVPGGDIQFVPLNSEPGVTALSQWDEVVKKEEECRTASGVTSSRCGELTRMFERGVSEAQVQDAIAHVERALPLIRHVWTEAFESIDRTFAAPRVFYYGLSSRGIFAVQREPPPCLRSDDNAVYCGTTKFTMTPCSLRGSPTPWARSPAPTDAMALSQLSRMRWGMPPTG